MIEYSQKVVGNRIKYYREANKLSQKKLAELVNTSQSYIAALEMGGRSDGSSVSMKNICKIASVLGVSLDDLAYTNIEYLCKDENNEIENDIALDIETLDYKKLVLFDNIISIFNK